MAPLSHAHVNLLFRFDYLPTLFLKICFLCNLTNAIYSSLKDYNSPRNIAAKSPSVWMMLSLSNPFSTAPSRSHLSTCEVFSKATRPSISHGPAACLTPPMITQQCQLAHLMVTSFFVTSVVSPCVLERSTCTKPQLPPYLLQILPFLSWKGHENPNLLLCTT